MAGRKYDSGRQAVTWLATVIVIFIGAVATGVVILAAAEKQVEPWIVWGICFSSIILILIVWNIRWEEPINQLKFWLSFQKKDDPTEGYAAARRSIETRERYGTNQPPSVESVRDAANHGGAWVPRSAPKSDRRNSP